MPAFHVIGVAVSSLTTVALAAPPAYHTSVASSSPLVWYRFDEASGNVINHGSLSTAFDAVVNGTVGRQAATGNGDPGVSLTQGGWLESLGSIALTGNPTFSIEAVVRLQSGGAANLWGPFMHWGNAGAAREVYFGVQSSNNNRVYAGFYNAGLRTAPLCVDRFIHVAWVRQGGTDSEAGTTLYINGLPSPMQRDPNLGFFPAASINVTSTQLRINQARDNPNNRYFTGILDEVALYDRLLTPAEIAARASMVFIQGCKPDLTSTAIAGGPGYGVPDCVLNNDDFFYFLTQFAAGNLAVTDLTAGAIPGQPGYGVPNGILTNDDFFYYLSIFAGGC